MARENILLEMVVIMREIGMKIRYQVLGDFILSMGILNIMGSGEMMSLTAGGLITQIETRESAGRSMRVNLGME